MHARIYTRAGVLVYVRNVYVRTHTHAHADLANKGTDHASKGTDHAKKGTDHASKGTDHAKKGTDNANKHSALEQCRASYTSLQHETVAYNVRHDPCHWHTMWVDGR